MTAGQASVFLRETKTRFTLPASNGPWYASWLVCFYVH